ncbi:TNFAIP3-interacting protein 3 [Rhineura floridana]|uniref:TNFAIP3-interacting protein 3 n=1 Tax=Rhineura floridana TaxID=261503 RepID=UPI002AC81ED5|nr:TNFAIP3-interacting protein 3 [Rhineura floridana]
MAVEDLADEAAAPQATVWRRLCRLRQQHQETTPEAAAHIAVGGRPAAWAEYGPGISAYAVLQKLQTVFKIKQKLSTKIILNPWTTTNTECDSVQLDDEIRILIWKNAASESCKKLESSSHPLNSFSKHNPVGCSGQLQAGMDDKRTSGSLSEDTLTKKMPTDVLQQQIILLEKQRQELLAVNNQWDQQFRQMKQQCEKKVTEVKAKLETMQESVKEQEKERHQMQQECRRLEALATSRLVQEMRDKKTLKEENRLLKEEASLANTKNINYECEISRLNKALLDALKNQSASLHVPHVDSLGRNSNHEEMRMQMEVLRQQVQIYEEDFKKERSDRERLNEEKEALQRINERIQSQLENLHSQVKDCQEEKERLEKQVKQQARDLRALMEKHGFPHQMFDPPCLSCRNCGLFHPYPEPQITLASYCINGKQQPPPDYQWYVPDRFPPDVQHKGNDVSSEKDIPNL